MIWSYIYIFLSPFPLIFPNGTLRSVRVTTSIWRPKAKPPDSGITIQDHPGRGVELRGLLGPFKSHGFWRFNMSNFWSLIYNGSRTICKLESIPHHKNDMWMFPTMLVPNNHGVFLLKMIILGCFGGTTI